MGFGINSWYYHSLQYRPVWDCGSGQYGDVIWFANGLNIQKAYFNLGTISGNVNFNYLHRNGAADLFVEYTNNPIALTSIVNTDGTASWTYTYDGTSSIVAISMTTRSNSSIDQWFKVKADCPVPTTTTTTTTTTSTTTTTTTAALVNVTLTPCYTQGAGGECTVTITSDTVLDTTITVNVTVDDDFTGSGNGDVIVSVGNTVGTSGTITLSNGAASAVSVNINSITPNPSSGQNYNPAGSGGAC